MLIFMKQLACFLFYVLIDESSSQEKKVFNDVVSSDTSKGLVHAFFSQRATSKVLEVMLVPPPSSFLVSSI